MATKVIIVQDREINLFTHEESDYICLTDMARGFEGDAGEYLRNWMRTGNTLEFLGAWEKVHNPNFNLVEFHQIKAELTRNTFLMSVKKWLDRTAAVGIEARAGRYGGTYAHSDIAIQFATWLSPEFYVHLIKEFQRMKLEESRQLDAGWNLRRQLTKINWQLHTEAVRQHLVPEMDWNTRREAIFQASEADLLNLALFNITARDWKNLQTHTDEDPGNLRDNASAVQLLVLANLESLNTKLLEWNLDKEQRFQILADTARQQTNILTTSPAVRPIELPATPDKKLPAPKDV